MLCDNQNLAMHQMLTSMGEELQMNLNGTVGMEHITVSRPMDTLQLPQASDALSSISGSTSLSMSESRDDLSSLYDGLDMEHLCEERFKIDRKKLESMLFETIEDTDKATLFFQKIQEETFTRIAWPGKRILGARSKKGFVVDPHIRIIGEPENVAAARNRILEVFNQRTNRVTLKMDLSYTDHSHIIGREGKTIQQVMSSTECHIHFPDSNKTSTTDKSNMVTITGDIENVELAREQVRRLMPVVFTFEVGPSFSLPENSSRIRDIQIRYNVQVFIRSHPVHPTTQVCVKGNHWEVDSVKQATLLLVQYICGQESVSANQISVTVQMALEISTQHHKKITWGDGASSVKVIMQRTSTNITYPDPSDPTTPPLMKSTFTISGSINNVFLARQQLLGSLPLSLMFDIREDQDLDPARVQGIMRRCGVVVRVKPKLRQPLRSVIVIGNERNATNIYEARRLLMCLDEPVVLAKIPRDYFIPKVPILQDINQGNQVQVQMQQPNSVSPSITMNNLVESLRATNLAPMMATTPPTTPTWLMAQTPPPQQPYQYHYTSYMQPAPTTNYWHGANNMVTSDYASCSGSDIDDHGATSICSSRTTSPDFHSVSTTSSGDDSCFIDNSHGKVVNEYDRRYDRPSYSNYEERKMQAMNAMQEQPSKDVPRIPTNMWSGLGFSKTESASVLGRKLESIKAGTGQMTFDEGTWKKLPNSLTSTAPAGFLKSELNSTSQTYSEKGGTSISEMSRSKDLATLLMQLHLGKYTELFTTQEIDIGMFSTLTEKDLQRLGVSTFGARRKMLMAIQVLSKKNTFSGSAAPGAELRSKSEADTPASLGPLEPATSAPSW